MNRSALSSVDTKLRERPLSLIPPTPFPRTGKGEQIICVVNLAAMTRLRSLSQRERAGVRASCWNYRHRRAIQRIRFAGHAALGCYGIAGMSARGLRDGFAELLHRESVDRGVEVTEADGGLAIEVYVVIQYGIRITEVAHNLQEAVKFAVERSVKVPVLEVNVNVQGVREER